MVTKMDFNSAKTLIEKGNVFDIDQADFKIDQYEELSTYDFHDSNSYENEYETITKQTLLHVAITCKNKSAVQLLLESGAATNILFHQITKRRNRYAVSGEGLFNTAVWSKWSNWSEDTCNTSTMDLAKMTHVLEIVSMIERYSSNEEKLKSISPKVGEFLPMREINYELDAIQANDAFAAKKIANLAVQDELIQVEPKIPESSIKIAEESLTQAENAKKSDILIEALEKQRIEFKTKFDAYEAEKKDFLKDCDNLTEKLKHKTSKDGIIENQVKVEKLFFDPDRTKNDEVLKQAQMFQERRSAKRQLDSLNLGQEKIPVARVLITAERYTLGMKGSWQKNLANQKKFNNKQQYFTFYETLEIGNTLITYCQKINSHYNHLGDYWMDGIHDYPRILQLIEEVTKDQDQKKEKDREIKLSELMLKFAHEGQPVHLANLQQINPSVDQSKVDNMNRIFYHCFVKEIARWMLPRDIVAPGCLPLATAQARAVKLITLGKLRMKQVFGGDSDYGVFTGKNLGLNVGSIKQKIESINDLYEQTVLTSNMNRLDSLSQILVNKKQLEMMACRSKRIHRELVDAFGGESDTDEPGYDSDDEEIIEILQKNIS